MQFRTPSKNNTISNKDIEKEFKNLRKELLDLTLRNPLLSFKPRNRNLSIINQTPMNAYKILVIENKRMYFSPNKAETKRSRAHTFIDQTKEFLSSETDKTLKADLTPSELQRRLFYIDQQSKTMVQEQGYNILYIALGFIEWIDKKKPRQKNLAPLILIPVALERKKVGNSFSLSWTGEDIQNNISIQAKLREAGIELPKFEQTSYIEGVNQYLADVKKAIRPFGKWDVKDDVALGFFSFTKFVMYNDLNPESWSKDVDLTENELIQAIFNPSKNIYEDTFEEEDVDEKLHYKTMYQVLDADSSQIAVIENVKAGHNLVVEGPPGTGKSQTIVNLIAELIAEGKTVLFVSEKMAALEVVKSRLDSVGLGKFVLELHSHKTRRKQLLKNLKKASNVRATRDLKLDQTLRKLENLRDQLDEYAEVIHAPVANVNLSPFELYGMKEASEDYFARQNRMLPLVRFDNAEDLSMKDLDDIIISLENLAELYSTISKNNPWSYCNPKSLLPADLREIELLIRDSLESLNDFRYEMNIVNEVYGIRIPNTLKEYEDSITALNILNSESANLVDSSVLLSKHWFNNPEKSLELIKLLQHYQHASGLFNKFSDYLLVADLDTIIYDLERESNKKFKLFGGNSHKEELYKLYNGNVPSDREALNDLIKVRNHIKIRQSLNDNEILGRAYFGNLWSKNADINELKQVANWMNKFVYLIKNGTFSENTVKMLSNDLFLPDIDSGIEEYVEKGNRFYENLKKLESKLNPRSRIIFKRETDDVPFDAWENQLNKWKGQLSSLHLWSQYSNTKRACRNSEASLFIKTIEKRNIKKDDVKSLVLGNFADSLLNIVFNENDTLATFIGELHENRIKEFKDLDVKIINLNRKRIFNKLNSEIPKIYGAANDPEAKVLAGEFTRKSGHLPVRTLLEKAGGTIKKIKPVFMMSPLSIAQYLDPTNPKLQFDVVIFDEASQVKPEDALGAFMRGKTAVVMGDTQQLPPTSFFDQMTDSESGEEVATALDMESILHLCKLSFPVKMLKWHYRSRHESLINISNREFYDNELLVYPSPSHTDPELGLKFHYNPNTQYHRGEGSANPLEAKDVVKEIFRHFERYGDKKSLGVGTFSVAQKNAILEELEIERKAHPEFEALFSENKEERFFVKNLETIQGDERDVILISVGYGYDTEGKMSLNFGPLNQDGGERRLNVLVTRAREKCVVFTNFRAHDIHLTANPPFGVKSLQSFLEYAENLHYNQDVQYDDYDEAPFEDAIYNFIAENGYEVDKKVGCAGFRVDLAIIDPDNPGKYILGIQCDGHNYASSKVARDRDRLREQVLNGLGWNIYHIWSTDWYRNRDLARAKLLENIESTITSTKVKDLKKKINDVESMKINPVTTVVLGKDDENEDDDYIADNEEDDISIIDNDLANIQSIKEEMDEKAEKEKEKEDLINRYLEDFDDELTKESSDESKSSVEDKTSIEDEFSIENIPDLVDDEYDESIHINEDIIKEKDKKVDIPVEDKKPIQKEIDEIPDIPVEDKKPIQKEIDEIPDIPVKDNIINEKDQLKQSNTHKKQEKSQKTKSKQSKNTKFNSSKDDVSSKFEGKSKVKESKVKGDASNKKDVLDGEFKVKERAQRSESFENSSNRNRSNDNNRAKSLMNRLRNIGDELVNNKQNNDSQDIKEPKKVQKEQKKKIEKPKKEKSIDKAQEQINKKSNKKEVQKETKIEIKDESIDFDNESKDNEIDENVNLYKEEELNIIEDNIEYDEKDNTEEIFEYAEEDIIENNINDISGAPVYIFEDDEEDMDDVIVFGLEDEEEGIEEISEDIINEIKEEDMENNEAEGIENMREYKAPRRKKDDDQFNDSPDVIVPISAEMRNNNQNDHYDEDVDYISPIDDEEFEEYLEESESEDEFEEFFEESDDLNEESNRESQANDHPQTQNHPAQDPNDPDNPYYYSAVGIENALKKNAVQYPKNNDRNKTGIAGTVNSLKNEMLYLKASMDEIENPTEREMVYVIDRNADDEFFEDPYDPYIEPEVIYNTQNTEKDNYESLFTSKKHEYLDKIEEYTNSSSDVEYIEDSSDSFLKDIPEFDYIDEESEPIIPIGQETEIYHSSDDYSQIAETIPEESVIIEELGSEFIEDDEFEHIDDIEIDDDEFEGIITDVGQGYQNLEDQRIQEANVLSAVDNTRLTPSGKLSDYIEDYKEIEDIIIKSPAEIYDDEKKLATAVMDIVAAEGPVHIDIVIRRLREGCGLSRAGTKFKNTILDIIDRNENHLLLIRENDFLFIDYDSVKVRKRVKPNIDMISEVEIEKAIDLVLSFEKSLKVQDLAKNVSRAFGFRSTSKKTSNKITLVIDSMIGKGILINNNGKIEFR
ncbi:DUF3320 domain-containing protein [Methanobrevibacter sp.]|uniref:DUF3320 domain-containing protein n=1 Tax=Methanobrevibacter sp. TaxID=66852 RepID=UPI0025DA7CF7|nr:DUF3320 domain-containing protein [Methanobrevibacter sp.]MBQ2962821.1 DUF3320 domain-containing protein [Methanobrevibacter sp.]